MRKSFKLTKVIFFKNIILISLYIKDKMATTGNSAGGNLAAVVAIMSVELKDKIKDIVQI